MSSLLSAPFLHLHPHALVLMPWSKSGIQLHCIYIYLFCVSSSSLSRNPLSSFKSQVQPLLLQSEGASSWQLVSSGWKTSPSPSLKATVSVPLAWSELGSQGLHSCNTSACWAGLDVVLPTALHSSLLSSLQVSFNTC